MFASKKPFSSVSVHIDRLTTEEYPENDLSGLPELIEAIKLQDSGPTEASRAIRKKLKYGNVHRQLRALTILDALIGNAGIRFQRCFADEPLLERLRIASTDTMTDVDVKAKCKTLFDQWSVAYKGTPGLTGIANLYKQLPQRRRPRPQPATSASREGSPEEGREIPSVATSSSPKNNRNMASPPRTSATANLTANLNSSKPHKKSDSKFSKKKIIPFNLEKEKPALLQSLANASVASTNLRNALKLIDREKERPSENFEAVKRFNDCKDLRRSILRYIQHVESEQWLGGLIHANEELVEALTLYEMLDKPIDQDSDSDDESWNDPTDEQNIDNFNKGMKNMKIEDGEDGDKPAMPPRPGSVPTTKGKARGYESEEQDEEDPNDPFGDNQYRVSDTTPAQERPGMTWRVV